MISSGWSSFEWFFIYFEYILAILEIFLEFWVLYNCNYLHLVWLFSCTMLCFPHGISMRQATFSWTLKLSVRSNVSALYPDFFPRWTRQSVAFPLFLGTAVFILLSREQWREPTPKASWKVSGASELTCVLDGSPVSVFIDMHYISCVLLAAHRSLASSNKSPLTGCSGCVKDIWLFGDLCFLVEMWWG